MIAVFRRELGSCFRGVIGYLLSAFVLIFAGIYTMAYNLSGYCSNFEYVLNAVSFIYLIAVPVISMRALAEERRQKTDQLLYSLPVRLSDVVIGKYLGMVCVLLLPTGIMALYPLLLSRWGAVSYANAYGALFAFFLLGACLLSVGLFISSLTESQVAAAVITLAAMLLLYFMSGLSSYVPSDSSASLIALCLLAVVFAFVLWRLTGNSAAALGAVILLDGGLIVWHALSPAVFEGLFPKMMNAISVFERFQTFSDGVFDLTAIVYYLSVIAVFLFLTVQSMEKRRWSE